MSLPSFVQWKSGAIVASLVAALPLAGCQRSLPPPEPPPFAGVALKVSCPAAAAGLIRDQSRAWAGRQGATVEVVEAAAGADIWLLPPAGLPHWAAAGKLAEVPAALRERGGSYDWNGLLPLYREQLVVWDSKPYALPLAGEAPVLVFRSDLFSSKEYEAKFRAWADARKSTVAFRPPATWEELATLAEFFRDHHPSGKPAPSLPPLPADAAALDRLYYQVAASVARRAIRLDEDKITDPFAELFAFHYDLKTGAPRIAEPGFVAALKLLVRMQACRPAGASDTPDAAFLAGDAVMTVAGASLLMEAQSRPALRDKVGVAPVPGGAVYFTPDGKEQPARDGVNRVPYLGGAGWLAAVPASSANAAAAWDLLADLTGPTRSALIAQEPRFGGGPTREAQTRRDSWAAFDLDAPRSLALKDAVGRAVHLHGLKNPVLCLRTPEQAIHRAMMDAALRGALSTNADPEATLKQVARDWAELDAKRGKTAHLLDYRVSLGLSRE